MTPPQPPRMELRLFGPFELRIGEEPAPRPRSQAGNWLLALLILRRDRQTERSWLAETLWPRSDPDQALFNLRRNLTDLRRILGPEAGRLLSPKPRALAFDLDGAACDLVEFDEAIRRGGDGLKRAVELYRGPLLEGCAEEWVTLDRMRREEAYLAALERLAEAGDPREAASFYRKIVAHDPLRESAHRRLWEALAVGGDGAALTRAYRDLRIRLQRDLGADPGPDTVALYRKLKEGLDAVSAEPGAAHAGANPAHVEVSTGPLPVYLTSLVGRDAAIEEVVAGLRSARLMTLTGTGGVGKTRLAVAVAERSGTEFADGVVFVDLSPLTHPDRVVEALAGALGIPEEPERPWAETLRRSLTDRSLLLILDNCEHLSGACAEVSRDLLSHCRELRILATSRQPLGVEGERLWRVPSLSLPPADKLVILPTESLLSHEAVRLFVERAVWSEPRFELTPDNAPAVMEVCRRVDGIPLALELAAARMRGLTAPELAGHLRESFDLLTRRNPSGLTRHQTLRATMDWGYGLLSEGERAFFRRLSVFAGGWTLPAAEAVCSDASLARSTVMDTLMELLDRSLVDHNEVTGRYSLLETVRQFAAEQLKEAGGDRATRDRHLRWCLALVRGAVAPARVDEGRGRSLLDAERENFRAALDWAVRDREDLTPEESEGVVLDGLRLALGLFRYWSDRDMLSEGRNALSSLLERAGERADPRLRAEAWSALGQLARFQSDYDSASTALENARVLFHALGDGKEEAIVRGLTGVILSHRGDYSGARARIETALPYIDSPPRAEGITLLDSLAYALREQGEYPAARARLETAVALCRRIGDRVGEAHCYFNLAYVAYEEGELSQAEELFARVLDLFRQTGNRTGEARALCSLGCIARSRGELADAEEFLRQSLEINRGIGHRTGEAWGLHELGMVRMEQRKFAEAKDLLEQALAINREYHCRNSEAWNLSGLATVTLTLKDYPQSQRWHREAARLMQSLGMKLGTVLILESYAELLTERGKSRQAVQLLGAVHHARLAMGAPREDQQGTKEWLDESGPSEIGVDLDTLWDEGLGWDLHEAIRRAFGAE